MLNEFPILSFSDSIYYRAVVNCNLKYADVSAGDTAEIWTDSRGYLGAFVIAQVWRNLDNGKIVFDGTDAWDALYGNQPSPVPATDQTGTLKIVKKNTLRPKFWRYYDEYATPIYTSLYKSVWNNSGNSIFILPQGIPFPQGISAEILSSTGRYSGIYLPSAIGQVPDMNGVIKVSFDVQFNGDDSGVLVYYETPAVDLPAYDKPYIDTTTPVPTVVNPTDTPVTVISRTESGQTFTQVVQPNETQVVLAPVEKTPDPPFIITEPAQPLKSATSTPKVVSSTPPIIEKVNPNPGATPTNDGNPGSTAVIPPTTQVIPITPIVSTGVKPAEIVATPIETPLPEVVVPETGFFDQPLVKLGLVAIAIFLIVKLLSK